MNKAQKLLQPLIDAANEKYDKTPPDEYGEDDKSRADSALATIKEAFNALATLSDAITLADVPAVEWVTLHKPTEHYESNGWIISRPIDGSGPLGYWGASVHFGGLSRLWCATPELAKRFAEIRIHLAAIERKLLAELAGGS